MSQLRHPNVVQFLGICYFPDSRLPVLIMEKLQISLDTLLETSTDIPLCDKVHLLIGTARGMVYLHSHNPPLAHRDLTARNILIGAGLTAKIADLGVARMVTASAMSRGPGNNLYMPPEAQGEGGSRYDHKIDIFSFGVVSLFTLTQIFPNDLKPIKHETQQHLARTEIERRVEYIQRMKMDFGETHPLVTLTLNCLEDRSDRRPSAVDVLGQLEVCCVI